jgi:hypothetical protein
MISFCILNLFIVQRGGKNVEGGEIKTLLKPVELTLAHNFCIIIVSEFTSLLIFRDGCLSGVC